MIIIIIIVLVFLLFVSVCFRIALTHPVNTVMYAVEDGIDYIKYKKWRTCQTGKLIAYTALFGKGKTLSVVHYITSQYYQYNNQMVYDRDRKKWVKQVVNVISNVDLKIPFERFESLEQIVAAAERNREKDLENDTLTITLVLGDEFSVQMNSRSFKTNIDPLFLNTLLTCRHHHITLVYDAQRFNHVDALLRQVTSYVVECNKVWRFMVQKYYDAYQLECASDPSLVRPYRRTGFFIRNKDYHAYDTLACVGNLEKKIRDGDMISEEEILKLRVNDGNAGVDAITAPSRRFRRLRKERKK